MKNYVGIGLGLLLLGLAIWGLTEANNSYKKTCVDHGGKVITTSAGTYGCIDPDGRRLP